MRGTNLGEKHDLLNLAGSGLVGKTNFFLIAATRVFHDEAGTYFQEGDCYFLLRQYSLFFEKGILGSLVES